MWLLILVACPQKAPVAPEQPRYRGVHDVAEIGRALYGGSGGQLGEGSPALGDVNGDGRPDLLLGDGGARTADGHDGVAWLLYGPLEAGDSLERADAIFSGPLERGAGEGVALADFNGDGFADPAISAVPRTQDGCGAVSIFFGPTVTSRVLPASDVRLTAPYDLEECVGATLRADGDTDGDGRVDLWIGGLGGANEPTRLTSFRRMSELGPGTRSLEFSDTTLRVPGYTGYRDAFATAGDLDGDGRADVVIGGATNRGNYAVFIVTDPPIGDAIVPDIADATLVSPSLQLCAVSSGGDIDGDGRDDLAVGAEMAPGGGSAWLFLGLPRSGGVDGAHARVVGASDRDGLGRDVSLAPLHAGQRPSLLVSESRGDRRGREGSVGVWYEAPSGTVEYASADATFVGPAGTRAGSSLATGDLDGDGASELLVGALGMGGALWVIPGR